MRAIRLYYLASYGGLGAVLPLLALAMQARGFRPSQYAFMLALLPLSRLFAPPLWGALADRFLGTSRLMQLNTALAAGAMVLIAGSQSIVPTVIGFVIWALSSSSLVPLADAGAYRMLGPAVRDFARLRVFGSIGFLISALTLGYVGVDELLRLPFLVAACTYVASSLISRHLADGAPPTRTPIAPAVRALSREPGVLWLWLGTTFYYAGHGCFDSYFGPHARTVPGMSASLISAAWGIGVGCEVLALWFVPRLLSGRVPSVLLVVAACLAMVRWLVIAQAPSAAVLLLQQPLHAVSFGVWYACLVHENQRRAPPAIRATVQGVASACMGLGMITATLLGGPVLEHFGGRVLFRCAAVASLLAGACYALRTLRLREPSVSPKPSL